MTARRGRRRQPFDVCGEAAAGMTLLQASAGTGKTFTIAALTTRYVAEAACRSTACSSSRSPAWPRASYANGCGTGSSAPSTGWSTPSAARARHEDDEIVRLLATAPRRRSRRGADRLGKAIADFDAATIETTHGFCLQVLYGLGTAGDVDRGGHPGRGRAATCWRRWSTTSTSASSPARPDTW